MRILYGEGSEEIMKKSSSLCESTPVTGDEHSKVTPSDSRHEGSGYVRKGVVGDWRNHFTKEQLDITKAWIAEKCKNSAVLELWADLDLP